MVKLTEISDDVNLFVYSDSGFTASVGTSEAGGTTAERVILLAGVENLYIRVALVSGSKAEFNLAVMEAGSEAEGPGPETASNLGNITTSAAGNGSIEFIDYDLGFDADWWQFSIASAQDVTIETSQLGEQFDTEMWLYKVDTTLAAVEYAWDGSGNDLIGYNDDSVGLYSQIVEPLSAGTYVVRVGYSTFYGTPGEGEYTVTVSVP